MTQINEHILLLEKIAKDQELLSVTGHKGKILAIIKGHTEVIYQVKESMINTTGELNMGILMALCDDTVSLTALSALQGRFTKLYFHFDFFEPVYSAAELIIESYIINKNADAGTHIECNVWIEKKELVARASSYVRFAVSDRH